MSAASAWVRYGHTVNVPASDAPRAGNSGRLGSTLRDNERDQARARHGAPGGERATPVAREASERIPALRFPWLATLIAIAAILAASHFSFSRLRAQVRSGTFDELDAVARLKAEEMASWRDERLSDARSIAAHPLVARALHRLDADRADEVARHDLRAWCESRMLDGEYEAVTLFAAGGDRLVEVGPRAGDVGAPQVEALLRDPRVSLSDFHVDHSKGDVHADLLAPIFLDDGRRRNLTGVAALRIDPKRHVLPLVLSWRGVARGPSVALAQVRGTDVILLTGAGGGGDGTAARLHYDLGSRELELRVARRETAVLETTDGRRRVLAAVRAVPGTTWSLVVDVDYGPMLATFRERLSWGIGFTLALIGLVLSSATLWWRRQVENVRRREHEAELKRHVLARHLELLSRHANDILVLTDTDGRIVEVNERAGNAYGCSRQDLTSKDVLELIAIDARADVERRLRRVAAGEAQVFETQHRRVEGGVFPVEVNAHLIEVEGRSYIQSVVRDITERKTAELVLQESEAKFRAAFFQSAVGTILLDHTGRFLEVNGCLTGMLGYSAEELREKTFHDLMHGDDLAGAVADFSRLVEGERDHNDSERRCIRKDGGSMHARYSVSAIRDGRARFKYAIALVEDVTERVRAEAELRESEERLRLALGATADGIWDWDVAHDRLHVSPRLAEMMGYESGEITSMQAALRVLHADERERLLDELAAARRGKERCVDTEHRLLAKSGEWRWVHHRLEVVALGPDGHALRMVGALSDITDQKALQSQLVLADRMAAVGTLAAGVAHEINTPLAYLISNLDFARSSLASLTSLESGAPDQGATLAKGRDALADASEGAERVRVIVRDLKAFSRGGEERQPLDVRDVLQSALHLAHAAIRQRARLVQDLAPVPLVVANASRLGQVFLNLLVNAAQALPEDGAAQNVVRVVTRVDARGRVLVEVSDTGCGIPAELLSRIFDPFFTTKPAGVGTGLGLGICHRIVSDLGGTIDVESTVARGTLFRVRLPPGPAPSSAVVPEPGSLPEQLTARADPTAERRT